MFKQLRFFYILCVLFSHSTVAEEYEDLDFELEFANHQKSTIETFPLKAIDQESLSDTAIEGALQVQNQRSTNTDESGKPIYQKQEEDEQKKQTKEALTDAEKDLIDESELLNFSQILPAQPIIQPIYQQPTGRTYTEHQTTTLSRP